MAPSGVAKETIQPGDMFACDMSGNVILSPRNSTLRLTQCAPLFMNAYNLRNAGIFVLIGK